MDIIKVLSILSKEFKAKDIHYAVIGGLAMNLLGLTRTTIDLDLIVLSEDTLKLKKLLESLGYSCVYTSENVSQYTSSSQMLGEIDIIHAFRSASLKMLKRCKHVPVFNNTFLLDVLMPEDIIGLKLQALVNDEDRRIRELADIEMILSHFKNDIQWDIIEDNFNIFDQKPLFEELRKKYG